MKFSKDVTKTSRIQLSLTQGLTKVELKLKCQRFRNVSEKILENLVFIGRTGIVDNADEYVAISNTLFYFVTSWTQNYTCLISFLFKVK